jgi:hypothetical protein
MLKHLYKGYFQKSRVFLYPALGIKKGSSVTPIETYISWEGHFRPIDHKLICVFHLRDDPEYIAFEKQFLLKNPMYHDYYESETGEGIYVFDYSEHVEDWCAFMQGKYSKLTKDLKSSILSNYASSKKNYIYVDSYLNPQDDYYNMYAKILDCDVSIFKEVVELCDPPNFTKEHLTMKVKSLSGPKQDISL